jgi:hypothetical protein
MNKCKICNEEFKTDKSFHIHLKKHNIYQAEYYCKYYPRFSFFYKKQIPFLNKRDYFSKEFIDLNEFMDWEKKAKPETVKAKALELLKERLDYKGNNYSLCHNEMKTLNLPPIKIFKKHFSSYTKACKSIGFQPLFNKPLPIDFFDLELPDFEMIVDTREQNPLQFKKTLKEKLYVGDYLFSGEFYTYTYIDRKSETDFLGTLASGLMRFEKEIQKAVVLGGYIFVVVETTIDKIKENHKKYRRKNNLEYVFHNMRYLLHKYPRKIQFVFTGGRKKSKEIIPRLLYFGKKVWNSDIQYYLDNQYYVCMGRWKTNT